MKALLCPDKFKGSLTAMEACGAIKTGIKQFNPDIEIISHPLADGGDGLLDILAETIELHITSVEVHDPLFRPIVAEYGITHDGQTAYIEMSKASGLVLLKPQEQNCLKTTTLGTGELILDAYRRGVRHIVLGLGGSATNDGGIGLAKALGYRFLDNDGNELAPIGENLNSVTAFEDCDLKVNLDALRVDIASDVQHLLCGAAGAAQGFAHQKGADQIAVAQLDAGLNNLAQLVKKKYGIGLLDVPGAGAAGGLGAGALAFLKANIRSGIELVIEATELECQVKTADLIVTGEGKLDEQTLGGKVIDGVMRLARKHQKPIAAICGACALPDTELEKMGFVYVGSILKPPRTLDDAMNNGADYLQDATLEMMSALCQRFP